MKTTTDFNNYTKEKSMDIEERIIALVKDIPYNKLVIEYKDRKWTYKYNENFTFVADRKDYPYIHYTLNGKDLPSAIGYVINSILDKKATQKSKEDYYKTLEKLVEEIQK